jgi:hypothetical protein
MYFRTDDDVRACDDVRTELMPFIQSQYAASVRITEILQSCKDHILPDADMDLFFSSIYNVETAVGYGLDVWGNIVGISRYIQEVEKDSEGRLIPTSITLTLDDEDFRKLIFCKASSNIMDSTLYSINYILKKLYPDYICFVRNNSGYVTEDGITKATTPMEITFVFYNTQLTSLELSIFAQFADFNRGAGVGWNMLEVSQDKIFGFLGSELQQFGENEDPNIGGVFYVPIGG